MINELYIVANNSQHISLNQFTFIGIYNQIMVMFINYYKNNIFTLLGSKLYSYSTLF